MLLRGIFDMIKIVNEDAIKVTAVDRSNLGLAFAAKCARNSFDNFDKRSTPEKDEELCEYLWGDDREGDSHWQPVAQMGWLIRNYGEDELEADAAWLMEKNNGFGFERIPGQGMYGSAIAWCRYYEIDRWEAAKKFITSSLEKYSQPTGEYERLSFLAYAPITIFRQVEKSKTHIDYSEVSKRYKESRECFLPSVWRTAHPDIKQGSLDERCDGMYEARLGDASIDEWARGLVDATAEWYRAALAAGCAPEQARFNLQQSMMTSVVATAPRWRWRDFVELRTADDVQAETRIVAEQIGALL